MLRRTIASSSTTSTEPLEPSAMRLDRGSGGRLAGMPEWVDVGAGRVFAPIRCRGVMHLMDGPIAHCLSAPADRVPEVCRGATDNSASAELKTYKES